MYASSCLSCIKKRWWWCQNAFFRLITSLDPSDILLIIPEALPRHWHDPLDIIWFDIIIIEGWLKTDMTWEWHELQELLPCFFQPLDHFIPSCSSSSCCGSSSISTSIASASIHFPFHDFMLLPMIWTWIRIIGEHFLESSSSSSSLLWQATRSNSSHVYLYNTDLDSEGKEETGSRSRKEMIWTSKNFMKTTF